MLLKEHKEIVVPGEIIAEGMDFLPGEGTYREDDKIKASVLGMLEVKGRLLKIIQISGKYLPRKGDTIIGKITDVLMAGWRVEINSAYTAMLPLKNGTSAFIPKGGDLTKYYNIGDYVIAKITNVTSQMLVDLTMKGPGLKKIEEGRIILVNPHKVPRIIGKQGSMISLIKQATECKIIVGQNGVCYIYGEPEQELIAIEAIRLIEKKSIISGLTNVVKEFLEQKTGKKLEVKNTEEKKE